MAYILDKPTLGIWADLGIWEDRVNYYYLLLRLHVCSYHNHTIPEVGSRDQSLENFEKWNKAYLKRSKIYYPIIY